MPKSDEKQGASSVPLHKIVMLCLNCLEWKQNSFYDYDGVVNTGICSGLNNDKVVIEVDAGWSGGVVGDIETDQDFFCANFQPREA